MSPEVGAAPSGGHAARLQYDIALQERFSAMSELVDRPVTDESRRAFGSHPTN